MPIHVVVYESEPHLARMISCQLMRADLEVHSAHDCGTAWDIVRRVRPQVLVTDLQSPAIELICQIRSTPALSDLPVIALSAASESPSAIEVLRQLDLYAILQKPFSLRRLVRLTTQAAQSLPALTPAVC